MYDYMWLGARYWCTRASRLALCTIRAQEKARITKTIQIKHTTDRSIGSVSFEPRRKSGKLKYSSTVRVYFEDNWKFTPDIWYEPLRLPCNLIELSFVSKRNHERKSKP